MLLNFRHRPFFYHLVVIISPAFLVLAGYGFNSAFLGGIVGTAVGSSFLDTHPVNFLAVMLMGLLWRGSSKKLLAGLIIIEVVLFVGNGIINTAYIPRNAPTALFFLGGIYGGIVVGFVWNFLAIFARRAFRRHTITV